MDNEISKKQFIIISIVVIIITLVVIISIVNSKNNNEVMPQENNTPITNNNDNISNSDEDEVVIQDGSPETNLETEIPDNEIIIDDDETNIDITSTSEILSKLKERIEVTTDNNNKNILPEMTNLSDEEIEDIIGLDITLLEDYIIRVSTGKFDVEMYIIAKPRADKKDEVKTQINSFIKTYTNSWSKLSAPQYQLLEDIKSVERKDYLVYIVSTDNETLMNVVREFIK